MASMTEVDPEGHLCKGDVALDDLEDPALVRVYIKALKTDGPIPPRSVCVYWQDRE